MIEISAAEQSRIDDLAYRLTNKPLTKTNIRALNLSPAQVDTIRRACIWGYEPQEIVSMYPYATLAFVLDQRKKFNHKLRRRFQISLNCKIAMCHCMSRDGKSKRAGGIEAGNGQQNAAGSLITNTRPNWLAVCATGPRFWNPYTGRALLT
ncbi:hypothetical protein ACUNI4_26210 [Serratia sp. IR-2025]